jgi:hypothetical protein
MDEPGIAGGTAALTQGVSRGDYGYEKRACSKAVQIVQHYIDRAQQEEVWHRRCAVEEAAEERWLDSQLHSSRE